MSIWVADVAGVCGVAAGVPRVDHDDLSGYDSVPT